MYYKSNLFFLFRGRTITFLYLLCLRSWLWRWLFHLAPHYKQINCHKHLLALVFVHLMLKHVAVQEAKLLKEATLWWLSHEQTTKHLISHFKFVITVHGTITGQWNKLGRWEKFIKPLTLIYCLIAFLISKIWFMEI